MSQLAKINELAARYDISTRTLRYYEQLGILWSERPQGDQPRQYSEAAVHRLEQILALRRLQVPVREIQRIFSLQDPAEALGSFVRQLRSIESEERNLRVRRELLESLLLFFRADVPAAGPTLPEGVVALAERTLEQRRRGGWHPVAAARHHSVIDVRIVDLPPMRMAHYHDPVAPSCFDTWRHMIAWACGYQLPVTRAFGYTSPNPEGIVPKYGYAVLFALPDGIAPRGHVGEMTFPGGQYAVTTTRYADVAADWRSLDRWVQESDAYIRREGLFLEELNAFSYPVDGESLVDLFYPVRAK